VSLHLREDDDEWLLRAARHCGDGDWMVALVAAFAAGVLFALTVTGNL
jgi:hypothetical protein